MCTVLYQQIYALSILRMLFFSLSKEKRKMPCRDSAKSWLSVLAFSLSLHRHPYIYIFSLALALSLLINKKPWTQQNAESWTLRNMSETVQTIEENVSSDFCFRFLLRNSAPIVKTVQWDVIQRTRKSRRRKITPLPAGGRRGGESKSLQKKKIHVYNLRDSVAPHLPPLLLYHIYIHMQSRQNTV